MKTQMKRLSALLMAVVLMTMMAACGSPDNAATGTAGGSSDNATAGTTDGSSDNATAGAADGVAAEEFDIEAEAKAAGQTIVYAATPEELQAALNSNTMIVLEGKDYTYEYGLDVQSLENMTILGTEGTRIMTTSETDDIINFTECKGMMLRNLVMGHDVPVESECTEGVVYVYTSEVTLVNCDIFGCGLLGIEAGESTVTAKNTTIRDCEYGLLNFYNSGATFENCTFSGSGNEYSEAAITMYQSENSDEVLFSGCNFTDNKNSKFYICLDVKTDTEVNAITFENCSYSGNAWGDTAP